MRVLLSKICNFLELFRRNLPTELLLFPYQCIATSLASELRSHRAQ